MTGTCKQYIIGIRVTSVLNPPVAKCECAMYRVAQCAAPPGSGSSPMLPPTSAHPSALSYRRDGTHSRPPSRSAGRSYPPPPPQGGAPQRHHRCPSHLYGETQAPGCKTPTGTFSGGGLGYRNFLPFGAQGEFSEPIIKIRQIALNSNSPKWPFGMILISGPRIERCIEVWPAWVQRPLPVNREYREVID